MKRMNFDRRNVLMVGATVLLAGCQVIPGGSASRTPAPPPPPTTAPVPSPTPSALPQDEERHRVALLVPMSGSNGDVGQSIANATTMALLDANADNLRITTYDTATGAASAAARAIGDGNALILGPLLAENVSAVQAVARPADVPLIAFSNDASVAGPDAYVIGHIPEQSIDRTVRYAGEQGSRNFAAIVPDGEYGRRAEAALTNSIRTFGGRLVGVERFTRGNTSITSAAQRLRARGGYDTVLIADGTRLSAQAAEEFRQGGTQILGTELWSGEADVFRSPALRGAWFSAVSDARFRRFSETYADRFGSKPYRIATLGYDAVLLALNVAQDWRVGRDFPTGALMNEDGFLGLDGPFRFQRNGVVYRAMEVREVRADDVTIVDAAPARF